VDRAVVHSVLTAIQPVGVEAALQMGECAQAEDDEKRKALELALERARYEANRARRQFDAVDPENRLVASELKAAGIRRWHKCLKQRRGWPQSDNGLTLSVLRGRES
jgi:siderophore synthetase component